MAGKASINARKMKGAIKMKMFDNNYKLLDEMYQDAYYPDFLVDKV